MKVGPVSDDVLAMIRKPRGLPGRRKNMRSLWTLMALAWALVACGTPALVETTTPGNGVVESTVPIIADPTSTAPPTDGALEELAAARARWAAAGLQTYTYRFLDDCGECDQLPEQTAVVWDGRVVDPRGRTASVEDAFALIEQAITSGLDIEVAYDPQLGYPAEMWIDREARAYDGGTHLLFSELEPGLPGDEASIDAHRAAWTRWRENGPTAYEYDAQVVCDCEYEAIMHTEVVDGRIASFDFETPRSDEITVSPITIDQLFRDVESMLSGEIIDGTRVSGSALYDDEWGFPVWIGLDIEVVDLDGSSIDPPLPDRLVFAVSGLAPIGTNGLGDSESARATWDALGRDTYTYEIVFHDMEAAGFSHPLTVEVVAGEIVSVTQNGLEIRVVETEIPTIDDLFDMISLWTGDGSQVDVIYDIEHGYPSVVVAVHPDGSAFAVSVSLVD